MFCLTLSLRNSRNFKGLLSQFKDFSRLYANPLVFSRQAVKFKGFSVLYKPWEQVKYTENQSNWMSDLDVEDKNYRSKWCSNGARGCQIAVFTQ